MDTAQDQNVKPQSQLTSIIMSRSIDDLTLSMKTMESVFDDYLRDLRTGSNLEISTPLNSSSTATSVAGSETLLEANASTDPTGGSPADRAPEGQGKIIPSKEQIQAVFQCQYQAIRNLRQSNFSVGWWDTYQKGIAAARGQVAGWEDLERMQTLHNLYAIERWVMAEDILMKINAMPTDFCKTRSIATRDRSLRGPFPRLLVRYTRISWKNPFFGIQQSVQDPRQSRARVIRLTGNTAIKNVCRHALAQPRYRAEGHA
ncbi:hypothetical protein FFLO_05955 [Filobasidium floriforme]|uniref:Uncharacterized protein n=1 Tax=Filobasidium floriforme TaxID=5210 RepID=A0A8K0JFW3_9TREE|nr:uncharacterized protein HD553DRAFT_327352 [Filobasidium floriforme]KAG7528729.1 hypothetical protein FFLO_05955 [Filobasidium floriforme]KAH8077292.1 hypothetical protein HD553DRAFT_327352 [Filobasidium floriforme]